MKWLIEFWESFGIEFALLLICFILLMAGIYGVTR